VKEGLQLACDQGEWKVYQEEFQKGRRVRLARRTGKEGLCGGRESRKTWISQREGIMTMEQDAAKNKNDGGGKCSLMEGLTRKKKKVIQGISARRCNK